MMETKKCNCCHEIKELKEFNKNKRCEDGVQKSCRDCTKKQQSKSYYKNPEIYKSKIKKYRLEVKNELTDYKKKNFCAKCKDNRYYVLDFHHKDPKFKKFNIGDGMRRSRGVLNKEIKKCVLLCRNCHSEFHHLEKTKGISLKEYLK